MIGGKLSKAPQHLWHMPASHKIGLGQAQKPMVPEPFGLASPWRISPGANPEYPNHHPAFTHLGAPQFLKGKP